MTVTTVLFVFAYGAMLGLIAKRELPASMQLPIWVLMASSGTGILVTGPTLERWIGGTALVYVRYPLMIAAGAAAVLIVATLIRPLRAPREVESAGKSARHEHRRRNRRRRSLRRCRDHARPEVLQHLRQGGGEGEGLVVAKPQTIILIRHGEKPSDAGVPHGVNQHGEHDVHSLSVRGWTRAGALAAMFAHLPHPTNPALVAPDRVFATRPTHAARSTRELDTAKPTASRLGLDVNDTIEHGQERELAERLLGDHANALVVWHHGELVSLVHAFPLSNPEDVPDQWPDHRFDLYWILTSEDGDDPRRYRFSVVPQRLLDGDHA